MVAPNDGTRIDPSTFCWESNGLMIWFPMLNKFQHPSLNVDFDLECDEADFPKEPQRDYEQIHAHVYREQKEEIENAIRILKMTDEEVVSTSTYNAIARYL